MVIFIDPSSMQDASHINFVIDLAQRGVPVAQWLGHRSAESEGLRFDSSWGLKIFSLSHARNKTKKTSFSMLVNFGEIYNPNIRHFV